LLLSIPEETLKKVINANFLRVLPEATMQAMFGDKFEDWKRMQPAEPPTTTAVDVPEHQIPPFAREEQRVPAAEKYQRVLEFIQSQRRGGYGAAPQIPAKRKAEADVVDLTED
jgi:hypothetical protein